MSKQAQVSLSKPIDDLLRSHDVRISQPREQMLQLNDVPVGPAFSQPMTNVLLRFDASAVCWQVFVDENLRYLGSVASRKQVFCGSRRRGWLRLASNLDAVGDVNDTIVWVLNQLESDLRSVAPQALKRRLESADRAAVENRPGQQPDHPLPGLDSRVARLVEPCELESLCMEPTSAQADAIMLAAESVLRPVAPNLPLLMGRSGVGKTMVAQHAAGELSRRGLVSQVVEISGAAVCAGPIFLPERDERLRETLDSLAQIGGALVILEQFDLVLSRSVVAASILSGFVDSGIRVIGVARAEFSPNRLKRCSQLRRRIEPCVLLPADHADVAEILRRRWAGHSLADQIELSQNVLPLVNKYSSGRLGVNPGSAIGLFEAVLNRADFSGQRCVGPDDVFHLVRHTDHS
jgi:hypothetical protein